ncbi:superoxide dismutase [Fusarium oxysporum]|nr:superoxide dismutase [Fusarium oxysporum]
MVKASVSTVFGTITFEQFDESSPINISWNIRGNHANSLRAFHIHEFGDKTNGCTSAGPHFNLFGSTHGSPSYHERHVGDLGNSQADSSSTLIGTITDHLVKLIGLESVIRAKDLIRNLKLQGILAKGLLIFKKKRGIISSIVLYYMKFLDLLEKP